MDSNKKIASSGVSTKTIISNHSDKPWLNEKGHYLSDSKLKLVSKKWDTKTWNAYLDSLDTTISEQQLSPAYYDDKAEEMESTWEQAQSDADQDTKDFITNLLKTLTPQQNKIITMIFWEAKSESIIADELKISRYTVKTVKARTLKLLSKKIKKVSPNSPFMRGENKLSLVKGDKNDTKKFKPKIIRRSAS